MQFNKRALRRREQHEAELERLRLQTDPRKVGDVRTLRMPGQSCDGMAVELLVRADRCDQTRDWRVRLLERRPMPNGMTSWKVGDVLVVGERELGDRVKSNLTLAEANRLIAEDLANRTPDSEMSHYEREDVPEIARQNRIGGGSAKCFRCNQPKSEDDSACDHCGYVGPGPERVSRQVF